MKRGPRVAVLGAGPAGCAAAVALRHANAEVIVLERGSRDKDKPCGDAIVPAAVGMLQQFGLDQETFELLGGYPFRQMKVYDRLGRLTQHRTGDRRGWIIPRARLDQRLRDITAFFAQIRYQATVTELIVEPSGSLKLTIKTEDQVEVQPFDAAVIAHGSGGALARRLMVDGRPVVAAAISQYSILADIEAPQFQFVEGIWPGYGWVFPVSEERVNIGVCALSPLTTTRLRSVMNTFVKDSGGSEYSPNRGGGAWLWSGSGSRWHHPAGIVSCGDAAGLVDPVSGEGITAALVSGERAGIALYLFLREGRNGARLEEYSRWIKEYFNRQYFGPSGASLNRDLWGV
jgi:menaquinone-9 beta-reductase